MQSVIVYIIVGACAVYVLWKVYRRFRHKKGPSYCASCPSAESAGAVCEGCPLAGKTPRDTSGNGGCGCR